MKLVLLVIALVIVVVGIGVMAQGYKKNRTEGSKRYHPGNQLVNIGLIIIVVGGLMLAMVAVVK